MGISVISKIRILPVTIAAAALAFGVHAGEVVRTATSAVNPVVKPPALKKPSVSVTPTRTEIELAEELVDKRTGSDDRKRQFELRERLLEASEKRLDAKLAELKAAESRVSTVSTARQSAASAQFLSLVKVYETMKPKDAARIFEKLDMNVQLAVATRMKERSMAAIMSDMTPEGARNLTMEMAAQAQLTSMSVGQVKDRGYATKP
jgi:flagellar motility protein MotE (MotC chaperone)